MNINDLFSETIKAAYGSEKGISSKLSEVLPLGLDSIYRRLGGKAHFTLEEAVLVARHLNISLDALYLDNVREKASFQVNLIDIEDPACNYYNLLAGYVDILTTLKDVPDISLHSAFNIIPYSFIVIHDLTSKFHLYKWLYSVKGIDYKTTLAQYRTPENIRKIERQFRNETRNKKKVSFVLDRNIFAAFAKDIALFVELELVSQQEKEILKKELLDILSAVEATAITGYYSSGSEVTFYLANITFDASYTLFESEGFEMSHLRVFSINGIDSYNPEICKMCRVWLSALQDNSTLITRSDSTHRSIYFKEQRNQINKILK